MVVTMRLVLALVFTLVTLSPAFSQAPVRPEPATSVKVVNQIEFTGNTKVSDKDLLDAVGFKVGELINGPKIERAIEGIQKAYKDRGYLAAVVSDSMIENFLATGTLRFTIIEARVAEVRIMGLHKTQECVVREVLKLKPNEFYSDGALNQDALRLQSLAIFDAVDAELQPCDAPGKVIIIWKLTEKEKTGYIALSGSYGPAGGLVGTVTYTQGNLRGRAEQLRVIASINTVGPLASGEVNYFNPVVTCDLSAGLSLFDTVNYRFGQSLLIEPDLDVYYERRLGVRLFATKSFTPVSRFTLGTRYEHVDVVNLPVQDFTLGITNGDGDVGAVWGEWLSDSRDSPIYPTKGQFNRAFLEPAYVSQQDGNNAIVKVALEGRRFTALGPQPNCPGDRLPSVLALRGQAGAAAGPLPFFEQFFLGGVHGLRGYIEDRFWGPYFVQATAEYRRPITPSFAGVLFVDGGDAWGSRFQFIPGTDTKFLQHDGFQPHVGFGIGARYVGPIGLLGLDFAYGEQFIVTLVIGQPF